MKVLNALWRTFDLMDELTSTNMMNEKTGSIIGNLIRERKDLIDKVDESLTAMLQMEGKGKPSENYGASKDSHEIMNSLQSKMTVIQVLFDVYRILSI